MTPRPPTIHDVAARAGVSKSVVSRVMSGSPRVSRESRKAVLKAAGELGYRPNAAARHLAQRRTFLIGAVVDDLHNLFFADLLDGLDGAARQHGYRVVVMIGHRETRQEEGAVDALLELRVDGLVLAGPQIRAPALKRAAASAPVVVVAHHLRTSTVHSVATDDIRGAELAVVHLTGLGHRDIAHITATDTPPARDRRKGYERTMMRAGLKPVVVPGDFTEEGGYAGATALLRSDAPPSAIFAPNDLAAIGAFNAVEDAGLNVPADVSIVGYDDTALAALRHISLTTIRQPRRALGERAMDVLLGQLAGDEAPTQHVLLEPELVTRATTGPPNAASGGASELAGAAG